MLGVARFVAFKPFRHGLASQVYDTKLYQIVSNNVCHDLYKPVLFKKKFRIYYLEDHLVRFSFIMVRSIAARRKDC